MLPMTAFMTCAITTSQPAYCHLKSLSGKTAVITGTLGMDRESFREEMDRVVAGVRGDLRTAVTRVDGFLYTVRLDVKIRYRKAKKAVKQAWHEVWR